LASFGKCKIFFHETKSQLVSKIVALPLGRFYFHSIFKEKSPFSLLGKNYYIYATNAKLEGRTLNSTKNSRGVIKLRGPCFTFWILI
jgi:hypothetical protein